MNKYGSFNENNEFVITNPYTPEAWLHYLVRPEQKSTSTFCSGVTHACGGFDIQGTHENTISDTKIHVQDEDSLVRCIYIKDVKTQEIWSSSWQPIRLKKQKFTTTFGFGNAKFESAYTDIETSVSMFVPLLFDGWIQNIEIKNSGKTKRTLELFPFVPMHIGDALIRLVAGDNDGFFGGVSFDKELSGIVFRRHHGIPVNDAGKNINGMLGSTVLFYSSLNTADTPYETNLESFFGDRFHNQRNPQAVIESKLSNIDTPYLRRPCGVFMHRVELDPGETIQFSLSIISCKTSDYYCGGKNDFKKIIGTISNPEKTKQLEKKVKDWWKKRFEILQINSSNTLINTSFKWLQYQCEIVLILNRMKSRFHTGYEYGWGFRDILQDILYLLPYRPDQMKSILLHISTQIFSTGRTYHNFFISQKGNKSIEASDDPLWFVQAVIQYCMETGDINILDEQTFYAEKHETGEDLKGTILEHCFSCLNRVIKDRSSRNLPYLKDCDWNDDLNEKREQGVPQETMESIMVAQQLSGTIEEFASLIRSMYSSYNKIEETMHFYLMAAQQTKLSLLKYGYDSEGYFKRALCCSNPTKDLGSSTNAEAKIFLEPQIFAITNNIVDLQKAKELLAHVEDKLMSPWGAMLLYPYFNGLALRNELPERTWNIEKEPPGMKENGGIFMHLNAWLIEAYCRTGQGNKAVALFEQTLPCSLSKSQDAYFCEPFVYPEYVRGIGTAQEGRGGHTWLTGTAPTIHRTIIEYIFGVKPSERGLQIKPCISSQWDNFSITRKFRNSIFEIHYKNPESVETGILEASINGIPLDINKDTLSITIPPQKENGLYNISIVMGN